MRRGIQLRLLGVDVGFNANLEPVVLTLWIPECVVLSTPPFLTSKCRQVVDKGTKRRNGRGAKVELEKRKRNVDRESVTAWCCTKRKRANEGEGESVGRCVGSGGSGNGVGMGGGAIAVGIMIWRRS